MGDNNARVFETTADLSPVARDSTVHVHLCRTAAVAAAADTVAMDATPERSRCHVSHRPRHRLHQN